MHLDGAAEMVEEEAAAAEGERDLGRDSSLDAAIRCIPWTLEDSTIFGLVDAYEQR